MKRRPPQLDAPYPRHRVLSDAEIALWYEAVEGGILPPVEPQTLRIPADLPAPRPARIRTTPAPNRLDLHGLTLDTAYRTLVRFLEQAQAHSMKSVLVITGKGIADNEMSLKRKVPRWLSERPFTDYVAGVRTAPISRGGEGALEVRLRTPR